jgi:signal transduction histidine kinase
MRFEIQRAGQSGQIRSWLGVPVLNPITPGESAQGVIATWSYEPNAFNDHHLWLLSAVSTQAAIAIRNARLFESSQRRATEMAFLNEVARSLSATLELDKVLTRIMEEVDELLQVEAGSLLLTEPATGDLVFQIALGDRAQELKPFRIPKGQGIAGEVALTGKPLLISNVDQDERHFKAVDEKINFSTRNMLCVPLLLYDRVVGVLQVLNKKVGNFTQHDQELLSSIASYAAIAIENARLHENVLAERDRVIAAQEQARKQLARDLHDGPTQLVANIMMKVDFCKKALQREPSLLAGELNDILKLAERASRQMRTMLFELRPLVLETQGLGAALQVFIDRRQQDILSTRLSLEVISPQGSEDISRQDDKVEAALFAIVQETVNNALKHAQAKNILVKLEETPKAVITVITDDGAGFELNRVMNNYEQRGSMGMVNIHERAQLIGGEVTIESAPGQGTKVTVIVPKEKEERMKKRGTGPLSLPPGMV